MHRKAGWYVAAVSILVVAALAAGLAAGCGSTSTVTETKTVTTTAPGTGQTATVTQVVTQTVTGTTAPTTTATSPTTTTPTGPKQTIKLSIGAGHPVTTVWVTALDEFFVPEISKRVEARTNYKIEWTKAWGGSIAKLEENLEAVESGLLDIAQPNCPFEPTKLFVLQYPFWFPFDAGDPTVAIQAAKRVFDDFPGLLKISEQYNAKTLTFSVTANYGLITNFEVTGPQSLNGKKIAGAGPNLTWLQGTGAIPVQSTYNDAYTSMSTGVYNGFISDIVANVSFKMYEVAPYRTEADFGSKFNSLIIMNMNTWNKLPKEVQDIVQEVANEYQAAEAKMVAALMSKGAADLQAGGGKYSTLSADAKKAWAEMLPNIPGDKAKEIDANGFSGADIFKSYQKHLTELGVKLPREWIK